MARVLVVDDEPMFCDVLGRRLVADGHAVTCAHSLAEARRCAGEGPTDVVFLDVNLPDGSGLDVLPLLRTVPGAPEVIIITGAGDEAGAELAIRTGAWDYLHKGDSLGKVLLALGRAVQYRQEKTSRKAPSVLDLGAIVGESAPMRECFALLAQAAGSDANVLVTGETGTGKELFAQAVHRNSRRAGKGFVVVDCAALPDTLVESLLFGHCKGAFTGAGQDRPGLVKQADGGTLFLDEVGELPLAVQKAFLRVLQERRFTPLGSDREESSDFRLVAATNRDLEQMAEAGQFRRDLLFRLQAFTVPLPALRDRPGDVRAIAWHHLGTACARLGGGMKAVSPDFLEALDVYHWPGNVRELLQALDRTLAAAVDNLTLFPVHLPPHVRTHAARREARVAPCASASGRTPPAGGSLPLLQDVRIAAVEAAEAQYLRELVACAEGDVGKACAISGLGRSRLYGLIKGHGLSLAR